MNMDDVEIIEKQTPFTGYFRVDRYRLRHRLFEGGWSGEMVREVFERGHAAAAILYDPDLDKLAFIEQFRPGAFAAFLSPRFGDDGSPWLIEIIAGIIEDGETPEGVARREAMEESNCEIREIIPVCRYLVSPGGSSESVFIFCGRIDAAAAGGIHGLGDEHENLRVIAATPSEAYQWLDSGKICNAMTIIALQWFRINRQKVRKQWRKDA
ncbi:MAG: ADP-ribose diphosphatase [Rhodospirillales bacterium RIFCSPLOWO2_12_FULL_58_28]|nr:MAG: ADP-ribose diphosphatase [Rhodospirillales bacterium RIFCSPLOWO2_02_FULL_58_16]OHC79080.1 MAG: ADP-ribose diphosphatase [Rhodospirillales bacterium RIFCSPLOWO2_12_FULL_58_28]